jgi:stalled ribosome alternative rescue factor ArfA
MIRSRKTQEVRERALCALLSEPTVRAAARSARVKEEDLRAMLVYPPFRSRYNQYRKAFNLMRTAMGYPECPAIDELQ